ncbi:MAG: glycosyltransferase [Syntrophaceae bacterium]|nr:glycosyltransferase [Syntrophaceae bacterium]
MDYFFGTEGGTERQVLELVTGLDQKRYLPTFAVLQTSNYIERGEFPCRVRVLNIRSVTMPSAIVKMSAFAMEIRRSDIDLVHVYFNDAAILAPIFSKIGGARVISSRRDMGYWYTPRILRLLRMSNRFVDRIAVNSLAVKRNVAIMEGYPANRIKVLRNGMNVARFESEKDPGFRNRLGIGSAEHIVGTVSNLYAVKRPKDLIRAVALIRERIGNVHLVFVGGGPIEIEPLKEFVRDVGMTGKVHFLGRVADAIPIIKHFDVCVSCSESEGLSNSIIEYMGCGKPVVCTAAGGNPELVKDGVNGFLVNVGDVRALANKIQDILHNESLKYALGHNGKNRYYREFTSDRMTAAHMEMYDEVLNGPTQQ